MPLTHGGAAGGHAGLPALGAFALLEHSGPRADPDLPARGTGYRISFELI